MIIIYFIRKVHLINELRVIILINMNIQEVESIKINVSKRRLKIDNCIKFSITINIIDDDKRVDRLIRIKKIIFLSFYFVINVFIQIRNNFCLSTDKNYIFYSKINFELKSKNDVYFHIFDVNMLIIQTRNVINKIYIISRHVKLNRVFDYEKKNYYITTSKNAYLIVKLKKQIFKNLFKLILAKFVDVFMFVFELLFNIIFTIIIFSKNINMFEINFTTNNNVVFNINVFTTNIKSIINRISLINEITTTREIIIYNNKQTRTKLKIIIDKFFTL